MDAKHVAFLVVFYITVVGALNWGLHALQFNLVEKLANAVASGDNAKMVENVIYGVVAACAVAAAVMLTMDVVKNPNPREFC
jgi:uncharacterized membrane protein YuzA (DUF378 family)